MNVRLFAFLVVVVGSATGCPSFNNAPGPAFAHSPPPEGKATIYFYRPAQKIMSSYPLFMSLPASADNCFQLESGGYTAFVTDPGAVTIAAGLTHLFGKTFTVKSGEVKYVEVDIVDDDAVLNEVSAGEAQPKIVQTKGIVTCASDKVKNPK